MQLLKFIEKESTDSYQPVLLIAAISGLANSLLLGIINHATQALSNKENLSSSFLMYMVMFALFLYMQWYAYERAIFIIENAIYRVRMRLTSKVRRVDLAFMEKIGSNNLYGRLTQNDTLVSQAVPQLIGTFQMCTLMFFSLIYLASISPISFIMTIFAMGLGVFYFLTKSRFIRDSLQKVQQKEKIYFQSISHLVNGFKEVKVNRQKGVDLLSAISTVSRAAQQIKSEIKKEESILWGFGRLFVYALLPILVFIVPNFSHEHVANISKISATLLFLIGPCTIIVNMIPMLKRVNMAIDDLLALENEMDEAISDIEDKRVDDTIFHDFQHIRIENIHFTYPQGDHNTFSIGPFHEKINRGELLFIIGGNGSGKSTFLKLLTGLYFPNKGGLYVNNTLINGSDYVAYRNLFSIIFTDFHLFDKFYAVKDIDKEKVDNWLKKMQIEHKVKYKNGGFTSTSLSTGQRKRLAFIAAMLEDKPVLVIDEFAADQDPQFRHYFYGTLLGELKDMGKTVIAVTHDDNFFHVADRIWKIGEGKIVLS